MANFFRRLFNGIQIVPKSGTSTLANKGELQVLSSGTTLSYHNGTSASPVVTEAHSATLTNKTIDADSNTITNIENADIKSGAAIARNKLASGTASQVLINDGSGVMTSEATLAKSRGGAGADMSSVTFPSTGTIVTEAGSATLTNKTIDADTNTISNIENADIKSGAAIARNKLASGTASHVLINDGDGVMTSESALSPVRGGTGVANNAAATLTRSGNHALTLTTTGTTNVTLPTSGTLLSSTSYVSPTVQRFTSGSGTYTTPANVLWIRVRMVGGGGGGAEANGANGTAGTASTFGMALLTAPSGAAGQGGGAASNGSGTPTINSPAIAVVSTNGAAGFSAGASTAGSSGGAGANSVFGGGGFAGFGGSNNAAQSGAANSGSGGGGGGASGAAGGGGGGAGSYLEAIITSPDATYEYTVGAGGNGGSGGAGGDGGAGAAGIIIVEEHYQ